MAIMGCIKSLGLPEHIFNSLLCPFLVITLQKACLGSFSFDRDSVNDE
jgi:hypothetical protein